ncbi:MAG: MFS transporter [Nitriliruptor sp.]|nr:MAG: MFS transporter [Nitriliruptor sp.]
MTTTDPDPAPSAVPARGPTALLLGTTLLLTALNLRAAVTSVGAVLPEIQAGVGMSDSVAGVLTTLPVLAFGIVGLLAARLGRRMGTDRALVAALLLITVGLVVRALAPTTGWVLVTSLVALCGMAIGNVLVPVTVKAWFPDAVGRYTGLYSLGIMVGTAVPVAVTVPLADLGGGWRFGLGIWAVPAALALVPWVLVSRRSEGLARPAPTGVPFAGSSGVRRSVKAWALMVFFGIQSMEAYVAMGWLPSIFQDAGVSPTRAGLLTALTMVLGVPVALLVPPLAARRPDQRGWVVALVAASVLGYLGLWLAAGRAPLLWSLLLGIGLGAFPLALLLIGLRARSPQTTSELSSLVQGWGYLLAAMGPLAIGVLHEVTGGWDVPLVALLVLLLPKLIAGLIAGAPGVVDGDPSDTAVEGNGPDR